MTDAHEENTVLLRVMYRDYRYDYVDQRTLDRLITGRDIMKFLRPSEGLWVEVTPCPTRGTGGIYTGPERRLTRAS